MFPNVNKNNATQLRQQIKSDKVQKLTHRNLPKCSFYPNKGV